MNLSRTNLIDVRNNKSSTFEFVDKLRFISMIAIVMEHCSYFYGTVYKHSYQQIIQSGCIEIFKFGTIIFFLISGFLIGDKIDSYSSWEYFKRRFNNTFKPWLFWVIILIVINYLTLWLINIKFKPLNFNNDPRLSIIYQLTYAIFNTSFWFIINYMICLGILLIFKKYINSLFLGCILLLLSLFYSVNLYNAWIPTGHTTAILGFVFYLWLGFQINKYYDLFLTWIKSISNWLIVILFLLSFIANCGETINLLHHNSNDAFNTLKITNIIFSLVSFVLLFKYSSLINVDRFKPRQLTYGIYLIHWLVMLNIVPLIFTPLGVNIDNQNLYQMIFFQLFRFIIVYGIAYFLSWLLTKAPKKIRWIVGVS